jgi:hypothetical protein
MDLSEDVDGIVSSIQCRATINEKPTVLPDSMIDHHKWIRKQYIDIHPRAVSHRPRADYGLISVKADIAVGLVRLMKTFENTTSTASWTFSDWIWSAVTFRSRAAPLIPAVDSCVSPV